MSKRFTHGGRVDTKDKYKPVSREEKLANYASRSDLLAKNKAIKNKAK